jgi:hypothetical protein
LLFSLLKLPNRECQYQTASLVHRNEKIAFRSRTFSCLLFVPLTLWRILSLFLLQSDQLLFVVAAVERSDREYQHRLASRVRRNEEPAFRERVFGERHFREFRRYCLTSKNRLRV